MTSSLHITLVGKGVTPFINLQPNVAENGVMDMGSVLAGEYLEKTFKVSVTLGNVSFLWMVVYATFKALKAKIWKISVNESIIIE